MNLSVEPVAPLIGAVVDGIQLAAVDEAAAPAIRAALLRYGVLFFREQQLDDAGLQRFGQLFGPLQVHRFMPNLGGELEAVHVLENDGTAASVNRADRWHSDATFEARPPLGSILKPVVLPAIGGDTLWSNMYAAYDALSEPIKRALEGLTAEHGNAYGARLDRPNSHPVVRTHPETGLRALFVNRIFTSRINELTPLESEHLLAMLLQHCESPLFQMRWSWRLGDVAFWDNRCVQHYAVYDYTEPRVLHRVTVDGDIPV